MDYRIPDEKDIPQLEEWISQDVFHRDHLTPKHWIPVLDAEGKPEKGVRHLAVSDENGVVFYLRLTNVMRVEVQFPPAGEPLRVGKGLREAFSFVSLSAKKMRYKEMLFDSVSSHLISFFKKLGFEPVKDHYKVALL